MRRLLTPLIALLLLAACAKEQKSGTTRTETDSLGTAQHPEATVIKSKPQSRISNPKFNPQLLYGTWTTNNDGPHADFKLTKESLYIVDSEDGGDHDYTISHDSIIVKYEDYNSIGIIKKAVKDTVVINWDNSSDVIYFTWKG